LIRACRRSKYSSPTGNIYYHLNSGHLLKNLVFMALRWITQITALAKAMAELKLPQGTIVTRNEEEQIQIDPGPIDVVPAWGFLLNSK